MLHLYNSMGKRRVFAPFTRKSLMYSPAALRLSAGAYRQFPDVHVRRRSGQISRILRLQCETGHEFTDIEDKAVLEAEKRHTTVRRLTEENIRSFLNEMSLLKIKKPDYLPRASRSIGEAVQSHRGPCRVRLGILAPG